MNYITRTVIEVLSERNRNKPTSAERLFIYSPAFTYFGEEFKFQHIVEYNEEFFILDFYIEVPPFKIAIEIDGATHYKQGQQENDRRRDKTLAENKGIITFRIPARHIYEGMVTDDYLSQLMQPLWAKYSHRNGRND
jgi:very-short-patch-repair endonuclease